MKATLSFNLSDPEEREDYNRTIQVDKAFAVIGEFSQRLHNIIKYGHEDHDVTELQKIRDMFWEIVKKEGLEIE